ncbi:PA domain-containing protein [Ferruginivarius sediminum]|nr:PA domain-containing protein [Ferruginivarius sediminum]
MAFLLRGALSILLAIALPVWALADHPQVVTDGPDQDAHEHGVLDPNKRPDPELPLIMRDSLSDEFVSSGPNAKVIKNLTPTARGTRLSPDGTTDVWVLGNYAYTGTFDEPCGGAFEAGIWVWDVRNAQKDKNTPVTIIQSPDGSRSNDVKAAAMNSGDILVHSNESCNGGPGGFEIYSVDDPEDPMWLASVQTDDVNAFLRDELGFQDFGVHNLFLFTQGEKDYVAAVVESEFGNFQIFDITIPTAPTLVGWWGAEQLRLAELGLGETDAADLDADDFGIILDLDAYLFDGFGASRNRFLHDVTITEDGQQAYLANWDAGLVLLDISDVTDPRLVSVALDPASEDGEVNSHSVWPSEDGSIVVEGEEDFAPFSTVFSITSGPAAGDYPAVEGDITVPIANLTPPVMEGPTTYAGLACPGDMVPPAPSSDSIALIQRGTCFFSEKIDNAEAAGYTGVVVFNDAARGDELVVMGGDPVNLPGVFVGHSTGLAIAGVASAADLVLGAPGASVKVETIPNGWSGVRIWDYTDPANPVLASTFNTECSANVIGPDCLDGGTYSSHNVIVESTEPDRDGERSVKAYISWYWDGMLVLDVTDPYNPVEIARYSDQSLEFQFENGGNQDIWGVYKTPGKPWVYGSDRNGGLYILKELGQGTLMN